MRKTKYSNLDKNAKYLKSNEEMIKNEIKNR